ncbi:MAG: shikimate dehydrogenase [Clostridia bacterium]|nr:shikimate dehydrogenase [Clostridia bacterium]
MGYPVEHSLSPLIHNAAFGATGENLLYLAFPVRPGELSTAVAGLKALGFKGANVTVPHKEKIIKYLDRVEPIAARIGAVNTIVNNGNELVGYNTDGTGFIRSLNEAGFNPSGKNVLILGAGGAARAVAFALVDAKCTKLSIANRTLANAMKLADSLTDKCGLIPEVYSMDEKELHLVLSEADLVINTTSLGMWPKVEDTPLPGGGFKKGQWVYDLVYNPIETKFLKQARERGCYVISGLSMLLYQGAEAFTLWTGQDAPVEVMEKVLYGAVNKKN